MANELTLPSYLKSVEAQAECRKEVEHNMSVLLRDAAGCLRRTCRYPVNGELYVVDQNQPLPDYSESVLHQNQFERLQNANLGDEEYNGLLKVILEYVSAIAVEVESKERNLKRAISQVVLSRIDSVAVEKDALETPEFKGEVLPDWDRECRKINLDFRIKRAKFFDQQNQQQTGR